MKLRTQEGTGGRYDDVCERLQLDLKAQAVVLFVVQGRKGSGMSVSVDPASNVAGLASGQGLPAILREMADAIEGGAPPQGMRQLLTNEPEAS